MVWCVFWGFEELMEGVGCMVRVRRDQGVWGRSVGLGWGSGEGLNASMGNGCRVVGGEWRIIGARG